MKLTSLQNKSPDSSRDLFCLDITHWCRVLLVVTPEVEITPGLGALLSAATGLGIPIRIVELQGTVSCVLTSAEKLKRLGYTIGYESVSPAAVGDSVAEAIDRVRRVFCPTVVIAPSTSKKRSAGNSIEEMLVGWHNRNLLTQGVLFYYGDAPSPEANCYFSSAGDNAPSTRFRPSTVRAESTRIHSFPAPDSSPESFCWLGSYAQAAFIQYRYATVADSDELSRLFAEVYGQEPPANWWSWKYGGDPLTGMVAADCSGRLLGFYGVLPRAGSWQGKSVRVCQLGDVMVASGHRFATRKSGVFPSMSQQFLTQHVGANKPFTLAFGFPTVRALSLGERLGLYRAGDVIQRWTAPVGRSSKLRSGRWNLMPVADVTDWDWMDRLGRMPKRAESGFTLRRSAEYWRYRYQQHPQRRYHLVRVYNWCNRITAAAIVQKTQDGLELMDLALNAPKSYDALLEGVFAAAHQLAQPRLIVWGTQKALADLPKGEITEVGKLALPGPALTVPLGETMTDQCWMLGGDTDFR